MKRPTTTFGSLLKSFQAFMPAMHMIMDQVGQRSCNGSAQDMNVWLVNIVDLSPTITMHANRKVQNQSCTQSVYTSSSSRHVPFSWHCLAYRLPCASSGEKAQRSCEKFPISKGCYSSERFLMREMATRHRR